MMPPALTDKQRIAEVRARLMHRSYRIGWGIACLRATAFAHDRLSPAQRLFLCDITTASLIGDVPLSKHRPVTLMAGALFDELIALRGPDVWFQRLTFVPPPGTIRSSNPPPGVRAHLRAVASALTDNGVSGIVMAGLRHCDLLADYDEAPLIEWPLHALTWAARPIELATPIRTDKLSNGTRIVVGTAVSSLAESAPDLLSEFAVGLGYNPSHQACAECEDLCDCAAWDAPLAWQQRSLIRALSLLPLRHAVLGFGEGRELKRGAYASVRRQILLDRRSDPVSARARHWRMYERSWSAHPHAPTKPKLKRGWRALQSFGVNRRTT